MFIPYAMLINVNSLNPWAHEMWDVDVIINGATNSDYKEGACVEWVWAKGTGKQNEWVKTVMWASHPKICYPFILMRKLSSKIMDFSNHCVLFISIAWAQFLIICRYLINAYWITFLWNLAKSYMSCYSQATVSLSLSFFCLFQCTHWLCKVHLGYTHFQYTQSHPNTKESTKE